MKISVNLVNLRECYFQSVSNSSWSHEGYLVALNISEEPEMMDELRRLNNAFGIGVIRLDAEHFMQSEILFSAKEKEALDWDTINRLVDDNRDFQHFLNDLMEDIKIGKVKSIYDEIYEDEDVACRATLSGRLKRHFIIANFSRKKAQPHLNDTVMPLSLHSLSSMPGY